MGPKTTTPGGHTRLWPIKHGNLAAKLAQQALLASAHSIGSRSALLLEPAQPGIQLLELLEAADEAYVPDCSLRTYLWTGTTPSNATAKCLQGSLNLFIMLGLVGEATVSRLPWPTDRAVLRILRPAESCLRRLIVVAARGLVLAPTFRPRRAGAAKPRKGGTPRAPASSFSIRSPHRVPGAGEGLRGFSPASTFNTDGEFVTIGSLLRPARFPPGPNPGRPGQRGAGHPPGLEALDAALQNLPRQARRLVRWADARGGLHRASRRCRPGRRPGAIAGLVHPVHELLQECQWLAFRAADARHLLMGQSCLP